jgi:hypothetical protein
MQADCIVISNQKWYLTLCTTKSMPTMLVSNVIQEEKDNVRQSRKQLKKPNTKFPYMFVSKLFKKQSTIWKELECYEKYFSLIPYYKEE